ncbi:MAG: ABC-three component system protein [Lachnospiraceae bacterium]
MIIALLNKEAAWVRNDLLYVNELEKYEKRLIDEWNTAFGEMQDDLAEIKSLTEEEKAKAGRKLLSDIEKKIFVVDPNTKKLFCYERQAIICSPTN